MSCCMFIMTPSLVIMTRLLLRQYGQKSQRKSKNPCKITPLVAFSASFFFVDEYGKKKDLTTIVFCLFFPPLPGLWCRCPPGLIKVCPAKGKSAGVPSHPEHQVDPNSGMCSSALKGARFLKRLNIFPCAQRGFCDATKSVKSAAWMIQHSPECTTTHFRQRSQTPI